MWCPTSIRSRSPCPSRAWPVELGARLRAASKQLDRAQPSTKPLLGRPYWRLRSLSHSRNPATCHWSRAAVRLAERRGLNRRLLLGHPGVHPFYIKASEPRHSFPSIPHLTSLPSVPWLPFRHQLVETLQTTISVRKACPIVFSPPHLRSSTLRHISRPSRPSPACNCLELFQASPMEYRSHRQHDIRSRTVRVISSKPSTKLTTRQSCPLFAPIAPGLRRGVANKHRPIILPTGYLW